MESRKWAGLRQQRVVLARKVLSVFASFLLAVSLVPTLSLDVAWADEGEAHFLFYDCTGAGFGMEWAELTPDAPSSSAIEMFLAAFGEWVFDVLSDEPIESAVSNTEGITVTLGSSHTGECPVNGSSTYNGYYVTTVYIKGLGSSASSGGNWCVTLTTATGATMTFGTDGGGLYTSGTSDLLEAQIDIPESIAANNNTLTLSVDDYYSSTTLFTYTGDGEVTIKVDGEEVEVGNSSAAGPLHIRTANTTSTTKTYGVWPNVVSGVVGTHTVTVSATEGTLYTALEETTVTVVVNKGPADYFTVSLSPSSENWDLVEGGSSVNVSISGQRAGSVGSVSYERAGFVPSTSLNPTGIVSVSDTSSAGFTVTPLSAGSAAMSVTLESEFFESISMEPFVVTVAEATAEDPEDPEGSEDPEDSDDPGLDDSSVPSLDNDLSYTLKVGGSSASFSYVGDGTLSAVSSSPEVATVTVEGSTITISPLAAGITTVTVSASAGEEYAALDPVSIPVTVLAEDEQPDDKEIVRYSATVEVGKTGSIENTAEVPLLYDAENVLVNEGTATSADESIVTASYTDGVLTVEGISEGSATVTIESDEAANKAEVVVTVVAATSFSVNDGGTGVTATQPTGGSNIPVGAETALSVVPLTSGTAYDTLVSYVEESILGVYEVTLTVDDIEVHDGFGGITLSFPVGEGYETAYVYHLMQDGTVQKSIALPVEDGMVTVEVDSLSTFAVAADSADDGEGSDEGSTTASTDTTSDADKTTGLSKTGDTALYLVWAAIGFLLSCAAVSGGFAKGLRRIRRDELALPDKGATAQS